MTDQQQVQEPSKNAPLPNGGTLVKITKRSSTIIDFWLEDGTLLSIEIIAGKIERDPAKIDAHGVPIYHLHEWGFRPRARKP